MSHRPAFTLLELLLATVLSTVLMIGVLAVVTDLGAPAVAAASTRFRDAALGPHTVDAWVSLLRADLNQASRVEASKNSSLALTGYTALDPSDRGQTHRPVRVTYEIAEVGGRQWIVRRQAALDVLTNRNTHRDLVGCGLTRFELVQETREVSPETFAGPGGSATAGGASSFHKDGWAYVGHRWFVKDDLDIHGRLPKTDIAIINDEWYVAEEAWRRERPPQPTLLPGAESAVKWAAGGQSGTRTLWRLRVWTGGEEPDYDRLVTVRAGGSE
jgi:hypothetical protein